MLRSSYESVPEQLVSVPEQLVSVLEQLVSATEQLRKYSGAVSKCSRAVSKSSGAVISFTYELGSADFCTPWHQYTSILTKSNFRLTFSAKLVNFYLRCSIKCTPLWKPLDQYFSNSYHPYLHLSFRKDFYFLLGECRQRRLFHYYF